ncbi:MAG: hypothetical protein ACT4OO_06870 [Nitrospiraceae bacterium]
MTILIVTAMMLSALGCAGSQGFNRDDLRDSMHQDPDVVTERDIKSILSLKPQLPSPFTLGVYLRKKESPTRRYDRRVDWVVADKEALQKAWIGLKGEADLSNIFFLADSTVQGTTLRDIRLAAARYGADAVLIVDGAAAVDRYNNASAMWYATLIGAYLASGTHSDALFMVEGALWDVRTEYLYGSQEVEGLHRSVGPTMFLEDVDAIAKAKQAALDEFAKQVAVWLRRVRDKD